MTGRTPCASIHSTMAEEQGAQQAWSMTGSEGGGASAGRFMSHSMFMLVKNAYMGVLR